ncbi:methyltransferase [Salinibacterium sp. NSLL150]|uniref:class I SAM-dependent methyltransferase n=1 Tax=unclassified Salinibacterium TaxID=2632331 RepID=UPI0018CF517F|nr:MULTISPECIES: class I SAM-dependent methyltransferase [unclassified Salinibacterium]MBH0097928.1 methyltransferase [Salinibacterium sp. NSLL35]MBH0100683.1 methyltransferase [Salinibacterium sp. NSLL150]MBH0103442.1 methyltransferase [Salinibacterium sp. NSLL16]MBH0106203.1 methyltransferase [Salinibacterium sp. NSLL17]
MSEHLFATLRRWPDVEAPNLFAVDASDRLILDEAESQLADIQPGELVVMGDNYGALTLGAASLHDCRGIRVFQDSLVSELALAENAGDLAPHYTSHTLGAELLSGARLVLMQLPRSLAELDEWAQAIARFASPDVVVIAGGRIKHMTLAMNEILGRSFDDVNAGRARQKSRTLTSLGPRRDGVEARYPTTSVLREPELPVDELTVSAHGGAFAGATLDIGTRFLLTFLPEMKPDAATAVDLGSGTGVLATSLALARPDLHVVAIDQSIAAVASTRETADANGVGARVEAAREDALTERPTASADLIVCNPPFHTGATVHAGVALRMLADARRVLKPGGQLWVVFNTHLGYRDYLNRTVGPTRQAGRNSKFTVTVSVRE